MSNWQNWKNKYSKQIEHVVGYEEAFVDKILSQIPEILPNDVIPQYHFSDDNGGNRYIDFMILNESKGYYLPIELDGTYKDVNHQKWKDFLVRQNSLITKFGIVLRFSNKQMLEEPLNIINKVRHTLDIQSNNKITEASKQKERDSLILWYKNKLNEFEGANSNFDTITSEINELRALIEESNSKYQKPIQSEVTPKIKKSNFWIAISLILVAILFVSLTIIYNTKKQIEINRLESNPIVNEVTPSVTTENEFQENLKALKFENTVDSWEEVPENQIKQTLLNTSHIPTNAIPATLALKYKGTYNVVCGFIVQAITFSKGTYLNFEKKFPDTPFRIVIWDADANYVLSNISSTDRMLYRNICVNGNISTFNKRAQIIVNSPEQIKVF